MRLSKLHVIGAVIAVGVCYAVTSYAANYYVNDGSTNGDVYCAAIGTTNVLAGTSPATPAASLQQIIDNYGLTGGDIVYVDTGIYSNQPATFSSSDSGGAGQYLVIQGSTNYRAGGTVIDMVSGATDAIILSGTGCRWIRVNDFVIRRARYGVLLTLGTSAHEFNRVICYSNQYGFLLNGSQSNRFDRCVAAKNVYGFGLAGGTVSAYDRNMWERGIAWSNTFAFHRVAPTALTVSNSVIVGGVAYWGPDTFYPGPGRGDFNVYWDTLPFLGQEVRRDLSGLVARFGADTHSTYFNPQFADGEAFDYHPRSVAGRWHTISGTWVTDSVTSVLIDFGNPAADFSAEPIPNGGRMDVGIYGNTSEASRSPTNQPFLFAATFNDGGTVTGPVRLVWTYRNFSPAATVRIDFSRDNGANWTTLGSGIRATNGFFFWTNSASVTSSPVCFWRVVAETTNVASTNVSPFVVRGIGLINYYVNDGMTNGDVYCTTTGSVSNTGLTPNSPKASIEQIFASYTVGGGDVIFVDTGLYLLTNSLLIRRIWEGDTGNPLIIQGSTHHAFGGTVFDRRSSTSDVIVLESGLRNVSLRDLRTIGGRYGVYFDNTPVGIELVGVWAVSNVTGFGLLGGISNTFVRCVAARNTQFGFAALGATPGAHIGNRWDYGIIWGNGLGALRAYDDTLSLSNSVLAGNPTSFVHQVVNQGDFVVFYDRALGSFPNLNELQKAKNSFWNSTYVEPFFADPLGLDFHPRSVVGTYSNGTWVVYTNHSPCIDLGDPARDYSNEPAPNGGIVNIGIYGNTVEASKSRTNAWLQVLNYNDGGVLTGGTGSTDRVIWRAGNFPSGATVRIEISLDRGLPGTWQTVVTGISAAAGQYIWTSTNIDASSYYARWRVVYDHNTNILSATAYTNFTFRSGPFRYYVNDASTNGDVYCTAPGNDANLGTSPGSPKETLRSLLQDHDIEPGDIIYIDTGYYDVPGPSQPVFTTLDAGGTNGVVMIVGSTNHSAGGTVIARTGIGVASGAGYLEFRDLVFTNLAVGLHLSGVRNIDISRVTAIRSGSGIVLESGCRDVFIDRCVFRNNSVGVQVVASTAAVQRSVFWKNTAAGIQVDSGRLTVTASVVAAFGPLAAGYYSATPLNIVGDYNCLYAEDNGVVGYIVQGAQQLDTLSAWVGVTGFELYSIGDNPAFADPEMGDFHPKTELLQGRWVTGVGWYPGFDERTSPLIDAGPPTWPYDREVSPNGQRMDIGLYGNTSEASRRQTNAWVYAASLKQGGWVRGTSALHWVAGGAATGHALRIEFSPNGGETWSILTNGIAASTEIFFWNTTTTNNTPAGLWRISSVTNTNIWDVTTNFFAVRNAPLSVFINDTSTAHDVYTTAVGAPTNWVATSNRPLNSLITALARYDFEPGDTIYVDSGYYSNSQNLVWGRVDSGHPTNFVRLMGSTNSLQARGTIFERGNTNAGHIVWVLQNVRAVAISNLVVRGGNIGVQVDGCGPLTLGHFRALENSSNGFHITSSTNIVLERVVAARNRGYGISAVSNHGALVQSVVWSNFRGGVEIAHGTLSITQCVLHAYAPERPILALGLSSEVRSDYNNLFAQGAAFAAVVSNVPYRSSFRWQSERTNDVNSLAHDPLFFDALNDDYHPRSIAGRFNPATGTFTNDTVSSPLIDAGVPSWPFGNEPSPNGARANIGLYGNSGEASRTPTNGWLLTLTLNDGGTINGTNFLRWLAGGAATGHLVRIDFSRDGGVTWTNIATNVPASSGSILWNSTPYGSTPQGAWRVVSQNNTNIYDQTDYLFGLNNEPLTYYVNDTGTVGDVYCTAPGAAGNDGRSAATPMLSLRQLLLAYDLMPGDRVVLDTGLYNENSGIIIGSGVMGSSTNHIVIQGSTNTVHGGSRLDFGGNDGIVVRHTGGILLRDLIIQNAAQGVWLDRANDCVVEGVDVRSSGSGFVVELSTSNVLRNCSAVGMLTNGLASLGCTGTVWQSGLLWSNPTAVYISRSRLDTLVPSGNATIRNSGFGVFGRNQIGVDVSGEAQLVSDFNSWIVTNGGRFAVIRYALYDLMYYNLAEMARERGWDARSVTKWPRYHAVPADFRLMSEGGRYNPLTGTFVLDVMTSPLIDAGDPTSVFTNETPPNGQRINIGRYGNTWQASRTPTNPSLTILSLNDGGSVTGQVPIYWVARGAATGHTVSLRYSPNGGTTWTTIVSGLSASSTGYVWNTTLFSNSLLGVLRIESVTMPAVGDQTESRFAVRNAPFTFYVNDGSTNGDVYCTAVGSAANSGLAPNAPKATVEQILSTYELREGDVVYVDTGVYSVTQTVTFTQADANRYTNQTRIVVQGSTNYVAGGTVFDGGGHPSNAVIEVRDAVGVEFRHLILQNAFVGLRLMRTANCRIENVQARYCARGFELDYNENTDMRHCVLRDCSEAGLYQMGSSNTVMASSVFWSNRVAVEMRGSTNFGQWLPSTLAFSNNVAVAFGTNQVIYSLHAGILRSDYNNLFVTNGARVSLGRHRSVGRWAFGTGNDVYSLSHDPLFADPVNGDFHLRSRAGRYTMAGTIVTDAVTSLLIDAGDPFALSFTNEPAPHGARLNIGLYGGTWQASRTPTNSSLTAVSLSDGGRAGGTNVMLYWVARGHATGHLVSVDYSPDGGVTWTNLAANLPATNRFYIWNASGFAASLRAKWRVRSQNEPSVSDETDQVFALRNAPLAFYVNDGSLSGDVYCTAAGSETHDGLTVATPKRSIAGLLNAWVIEPGDVIYVDTGVYTNLATIWFAEEHAGDTNGLIPVVVQGSTNVVAGGTLLMHSLSQPAFAITNSALLNIRDLRLMATGPAFHIGKSEQVVLERCSIVGSMLAVGIYNSQRADIRYGLIQNSDIGVYNEKGVVQCDGCVFWSNGIALQLQSGFLSLSNSVVAAFGANAVAYYLPVEPTFFANYNCLYLRDGAVACYQHEVPFPRIYTTLSRMSRDLGIDTHSLATDPLFANPAAGDFHLRSQGGRYNPVTGTFTNDSVTSPLIDAGDPSAAFMNEPAPNGGRRNIGLYGNTPEASRTPTNARLTAITLNDGGRAEGAKVLYWLATGGATGSTVRLEFSANGGSSWSTLVTGLPATNGLYVWDTRTVPSTIQGLWRVVTESGVIVTGRTESLFAIRNGPLSFYVNDASTNGDVYTTAVGSPANSGASPHSPKDAVADIFSAWDLEPGDTIYVDTGVHVPQLNPIFINQDSTWMPEWGTNFTIFVNGLSTNRLTIQGSTNMVAGGSVFTKLGGGFLFSLQYGHGVSFRDLVLRGGGIYGWESHYVQCVGLEVSDAEDGLHFERSGSLDVRHSIVRNTSNRGIALSDSSNATIRNVTLWSNRYYGVYQESPNLRNASLSLQDSLVAAFGSNSFAYFNVRGVWSSDYNCVYTKDNAFPAGFIAGGMFGSGTTRYESVYRWSTVFGQDLYTLTPTGSLELASITNNDFHLKTTMYQGRFNPATGTWTNDSTFSILLDSGNPASAFTNEPAPNGGAVNIGTHGNTWRASKTPTNTGWFSILTLNDGGTVYGTVTLHWVAGGIATGHYVNVDFSPVAGLYWTNIVTSNPPAARGSIEWDTTKFGRSFAGLWRVVSCSDTNIYDVSDRYLTLSTNVGGSVWYFVNDSSTNGDVYCKAPGSVTNDGFAPETPISSLKALIDSRKLEPGDRIYVDTGTYNLTADIVIDDLDSGVSNNPVLIIGSTNWAYGGTVLNRQVAGGGTRVWYLDTARHIVFRNFILKNAAFGIYGNYAESCTFEDIRIQDCVSGGALFNYCTETRLNRVLAWNNRTGTNGFGVAWVNSSSNEMNNCVLWNNLTGIRFERAGEMRIRNCVLHAVGYGQRVFRFDVASSPSILDSDYNNLIFENNAIVAEKEVTVGGNDVYETLTAWQRQTGLDRYSLSHAPLFVDAANGDFHETSVSPLVDTGDPSYPYTNEPPPNGARINMGLYGNTAEAASRSTNAWLLAAAVNDGGAVGGTQLLYWVAANFTNGARVRLEYSANGGIEWTPIASNLLANAQTYTWDLTGLAPGNRYLWRVVSHDNPALADSVDRQFSVKNANLTIYVNDAVTNGDVYCTAPGSPANTGLSPASPIASVVTALTNYPVGPGDTIYIDTGVYTNDLPLLFDVTRRGESGNYIRVIGSTNWLAGGTLIQRSTAANIVECSHTRNIWMENLRLHRGSVGIFISASEDIVLKTVEVFSNSSHGVNVELGSRLYLEQGLIWANQGRGIRLLSGLFNIHQTTIASNRFGAILVSGGGVVVSNSILLAPATNVWIYEIGPGSVEGDYNVLWKPPSGLVGRNALLTRDYRTLQEWQANIGADVHSVLTDPLFADAVGGDFRLRSTAGRWSPAVTNWVMDTNTSWAIDAAHPAAAYSNEPMPNGGRANVGRYGNTAEASLSVTGGTPVLKVASLDDGGAVAGTKALVWLSRNMSPTSRVVLEYSTDGGRTWNIIATNVNAVATDYTWNLSAVPSSPLSYWRVRDQANPAVNATNTMAFMIRNTPIYYYVNDSNTVGDVYCTAPGAATNLGYSPGQPRLRIQDIVNAYDVEPGDIIFVDTGFYPWTDTIELNQSHSGDSTNYVTIFGSTNWLAGGSTLRGLSAARAINLRNVQYVTLANLVITGAAFGVYFDLASQNNIISNLIICNGFDSGIAFVNAGGNAVRHTVITRINGVGVRALSAGAGNQIDSSVIWSNSSHAIYLGNSAISVSNSILYASGSTNMCYYTVTNGIVLADYNILYTTNFAPIGNVLGVPQTALAQWNMSTTQDLHSLNVDPLFQNPHGFDFHVKSQHGRYDPSTGSYVTDTVTSVAIDHGPPSWPWTNEPAPNGSRRNIGLYGNTREASKSATNAWVKALTASSGGRLQGTVFLAWNAVNLSPTNTVRLEYSHDNGVNWTTIVVNLAITNLYYIWDTTATHPGGADIFWSSPLARWKVTVEANTNCWDITDIYFALRNRPFSYYINDNSTVGDIYCTAVGNDTNLGIFPYIPKATLKNALLSWDLVGGDTVYIDTGNYVFGTNDLVAWGPEDAGWPGDPIKVRGNTNSLSTLFTTAIVPSPVLVSINGTHLDIRSLGFVGGGFAAAGGYLTLRNLYVTNGTIWLSGPVQLLEDVSVFNGSVSAIGGSDSILRRLTVGEGSVTLSGTNLVMENSLVYGNVANAVTMSGGDITLRNNTLVGNGTQFRQTGVGNAYLRNNIIVASGSGNFCIFKESGVLISDYNNLVARNNAWIGNVGNDYWEKLLYWQRESGQDLNSISVEPLFANESARDFRLRSVTGRWTGSAWTNDTTHSPCIDMGDPSSVFTNEPMPNGARVNMGAYGNTTQASKSLTNAWLRVMTMNDGGVFKGTNILRWAAGNLGTGDLVRIDYSWNNGINWTTVVSGLSALAGQYTWNSTAYTSSLQALWRVVLQTNSSVASVVATNFAVRNVPLKFYVNDTSTNGDVYCSAVGSLLNDGLTPATPRSRLDLILGAYDFEGGDIIYVDTGNYGLLAAIQIIWSDGGDADSGNLIIQGSTNYAAGGSVFNRNNLFSQAFDVRASYVTIRDFTIQNANAAVALVNNRHALVERIVARSNAYGISVANASSITNRNLILFNNSAAGVAIAGSRTTRTENCTFFVSLPIPTSTFYRQAYWVTNTVSNVLQNSIFYIGESNTYALGGDRFVLDNSFIDYNIYYFTAPESGIYEGYYADLSRWQLERDHDFRSAVTNPLFADVASANFYLQSTAGRFVPGTGWVADAQTSWGVDRGNPGSDYSLEPAPHGNRINIGAYGGTEYASKGSTSVLVEVRVLNEPTWISATNSLWALIWTIRNVPTSEVFNVQFSGDGGVSWYNLATNLNAYREYVLWQTTPFFNTYKGRWRVVGVGNTNYWDINNAPFQIFYGRFAITDIVPNNDLPRITWRGAWDEWYQVQYSTNLLLTNAAWINAPTGAAPNQTPRFLSTYGGDFYYEDVSATNVGFRVYRVMSLTNGP